MMHPGRNHATPRLTLLACLLVVGLVVTACGGASPNPPGQTVSITVSPSTLQLAPNATSQITATVTGSSNTAVSWSSNGGTVAATGNTITYTAPALEGSYTVTATSNANSTKSAQTTVQVSEGAIGFDGWVRQFGAHLTDEMVGVVVDSANNVVVAGNTTLTLPGATRVGEDDAFLIKLTPTAPTYG